MKLKREIEKDDLRELIIGRSENPMRLTAEMDISANEFQTLGENREEELANGREEEETMPTEEEEMGIHFLRRK